MVTLSRHFLLVPSSALCVQAAMRKVELYLLVMCASLTHALYLAPPDNKALQVIANLQFIVPNKIIYFVTCFGDPTSLEGVHFSAVLAPGKI